jgi:hypothetical protein
MLDFILDDGVDLSKQAVAQAPIGGPLVPVRSSALSMAGRDLRLVADSGGRSLIVVPLEFSHCLELHDAHPEDRTKPTPLAHRWPAYRRYVRASSRCGTVLPHRSIT